MEGGRHRVKLFVQIVLTLLLLYGLVNVIITKTGGRFFFVEVLLSLCLVLVAFFGVMSQSAIGEVAFFFVFVIHLTNVVLLWGVEGVLYITILLFAVLGFVISLPRKRKRIPSEEPHSVIFEDQGPQKAMSFVASSNGKMYHDLACAQVQKIAEEKKIWFRGKEDIPGYKAHSCVA